jgi:hypothetical protein
MNTRLLGSAGIVGGLCLLLVELRHIASGVPVGADSIDRLDALLYAIWCLGMIATLWAAYRLNVTGQHPILRLTPFIPMLGFAVGSIASLLQAVGILDGNNPAFGIFWIVILLGLLILGIAVLWARTWAGWRKFVPLACVLVLPVMIALGSVVGNISSVLFSLAQIALGFAVLTSTNEPMAQRRVAH